ncbi:MAG: globin domain-containing protein [Campylobacterales bacterium]|jgi:nitric oxide dioxygenase|nr:globin domain-containing protein [Campylobacterales bacterium]
MSLSQETITAVKETIPLINQESENVTTRMYEILFSKYPETKPLFDNADKNQHKKLAGAIAAFAGNIDNLGVLGAAVEKMAQSHVTTQVKPVHYPMVADALITAMGDVLGDAFTEKRKNAWIEAYTFLANILMQREQELYAQNA